MQNETETAVRDHVEIEIVVRQRRGIKPIGKPGRQVVIVPDTIEGKKGRDTIAEAVKNLSEEYMKSRLVVR